MGQNVDWVVLDLALENRLANANGGAFQKLFSDIMERIYGDDFIRVRPHGNLGDDGVDGYFLHEGIVYQCYGAEDGKVQRHTEVGQKMRDDFHTALTSGTRIREWRFTHNLLSGLPKPLLDVLNELVEIGKANDVKVGQCSRPTIWTLVQKLDEHGRERILGTKALAEDRLRRLPDAVNAIIDDILVRAPDYIAPEEPPKPISKRKLTHNDIPQNWQGLLRHGFEHGPLVFECISRNGDPKAPNSAPVYFNTLYRNLASNDILPGEILRQIHANLCGEAASLIDDDRSYAALAVMACMFESCEIFEDPIEITIETLVHDPA